MVLLITLKHTLAEDGVRLVKSTRRALSFSGLRILLFEKPRSLGVDHR